MNTRKIKRQLTELYYVCLVIAPYVIYALALIGLWSLVSCKKETPQPTTKPQCDCFEVHQVWIDNMGWANDYNTDTTKMNCDSETYTWAYTNAEQTKRKTINCL